MPGNWVAEGRSFPLGKGNGADGKHCYSLLVSCYLQLSPEEEEKRRIRRERNKMAAAKCRNRRRELTDTLQAVGSIHGHFF